MHFTHEHQELQRNLKRFIDSDINPYVDEWEAAEMFPAKQLFKKMGELGFLGIAKPTEFGGLGLDYSYAMAMAETLGHIHCGGVPMAIGVQTDMATPALARFGSDELRAQFLAPAISGDAVACVGVSEPSAGSDVASIKTTARKDGDDYIINGSKMWITNSLQADWMCLLANTSDDPAHRNKSLIIVPMNTKGVSVGKKIRKIGMNSSDTGLIYFDDVRVPQQLSHRRGRQGLHVPDAAIPGRAPVGRGQQSGDDDDVHRDHRRVRTRAQALRRQPARQPVGALQAGRAEDGSGSAACAHVSRVRSVHPRAGRDGAGIDGQAQGRAPRAHRA